MAMQQPADVGARDGVVDGAFDRAVELGCHDELTASGLRLQARQQRTLLIEREERVPSPTPVPRGDPGRSVLVVGVKPSSVRTIAQTTIIQRKYDRLQNPSYAR